MIDLHCHILPGIDDGPKTMEESVKMCFAAAQDGIRTIVATPHLKPPAYETDSKTVLSLIETLQEEIDREGLSIKILPGADVSIATETIVHLNRFEYAMINKGLRYFLAEPPYGHIPQGWDLLIKSMIDAGKTPIITHPERNPHFMKNPQNIELLVEMGALVQITAMSLCGDFGEDCQRAAIFFLENELCHSIATDAHSSDLRPPILSSAVELASEIIGADRAKALVEENPRSIIEDRPVSGAGRFKEKSSAEIPFHKFQPPAVKKKWIGLL